MKPRLSVVIPSRNGLRLLERLLPALEEEGSDEVVVVDDHSEDGTWEHLQGTRPGLKVLRRDSGEPGFCHAVNLGMQEASSDLLLLMNNDILPETGCFTGLVEHLLASGPGTAVAVPGILRPDGTDDGAMEWGFRRGLAYTAPSAGNPYPSGACALWHRFAWMELGGLSTRYAPIYWEDVDMGVRLRLRGFHMVLPGGPGVLHDHGATMGTGDRSAVLRERNRFIFMERWCSRPSMRAATAAWLPVHLALSRLRGDTAFARGYTAYRKWRHGR